MSIASINLSKETEIQERRNVVLTYISQGLSVTEISNKMAPFDISYRTVYRDVKHLKKQARQYIKEQQTNLAFEYQQVLANFYHLRKIAWEWFNSTKMTEDAKMPLFNILQHINNDIMNLLAAGDMIQLEIVEEEKKQLEQRQQ